ncbi:MAG: DVU_1551 family NTP transferase [Desulfobaccales bacterium]|jgi:CTP:molybdopterin cytidylyltransferase MocA/HD superfamily phosphohydrolase YqeK
MSRGDGISALILAAGYSSRLGAFKPLLPLGRATVIEEAVQRFRAAGIDDIRVVTGHRAEEIDPVLAGIGVRRIFNAAYAEGMLSSVLAGLKSFEAHIAAIFLLPADIPLVKPRTLAALLRAYRQSNVKIVYPCFGGLRGHPPLIATACVAALPPDYEGGVRAYLSRYECQAQDLEVVDEAILMDCDTPEDYERLEAYGVREDIPTVRECQMLWRRYGTTKEVTAHCRLVAEVARTLAVHLNCVGFHLNTELIVAAGYLHDLAKGQPDHARAGAQILEELGYGKVGQIVACHTDLPLMKQSIDESDLIYLADKYVAGDRLISLQERFEGSLRKFDDKPDILQKVVRRLKNAKFLKGRVEEALGIPLAEIMQRREKSMRMASAPEPREIYLVRHGAIQPQGNGKRYIRPDGFTLDCRRGSAG